MIHSLIINDFRLFKNVNLQMGRFITVISGKNALGKTTLLGMLGNACELKISDGRPILQKQFRTEFGEIFNASKEFDLSGSNKCIVNFSECDKPDLIIDHRRCRTTWQKISKINTNKRFRLIPEIKRGGKVSSTKYSFPSLYLGLSRLFPVGESNTDNISICNIRLSSEEKKEFVESYSNIMSVFEKDEISIDSISIGETSRKNGVGISTSDYNSLCNSAGQDNIGQIILSVMSFKRLKQNNPNKYKGGLLLIDELEATLHPGAQLRLINYLLKSCRSLNLQVVFTTHSLTILESICKKIMYNKSGKLNEIELVYITKDNDILEILKNPNYDRIYNDLNVSTIIANNKKISIYTEDEEARWVIEKILKDYLYKLRLVKIKMSYGNLLLLNKADYGYYSNVLFILDGDVPEKDIDKYKVQKGENILKLPGDKSIEEMLYTYLLELSTEHPLVDKITEFGITKTILRENRPSTNEEGPAREKYKKWFNDWKDIFESIGLFDYWMADNEDICNKFRKEFKDKYNKIAKRKFINTI